MSSLVPVLLVFLGIIVYNITKWVLKRVRLGGVSRIKLISITCAVVLSPVLYVGLILLWIQIESYYHKTDFNKQEWLENVEMRYEMTNDIIKSGILLGKTKDEVVDILGEDYDKYDDNHIAYYIGFVPGFITIDPSVLDIYFKNGIVVKVDQHET